MGILFKCSVGKRIVLLLAVCMMASSSPAHAEIMQRIRTGIEGVARGMDYVGKRTGELFGSGLSLGRDTESVYPASRQFEQQYPCGPGVKVSISNEFGEIRVDAWNERIVKITADIEVGAETAALSEQLLQLIDIQVVNEEDYLECRTRFPEIKADAQQSISVNYTVYVPQDADLMVNNLFGDVRVNGIGGKLTADIQYGGLEMSELLQPARVRVQGEFPVKARGLHQGGIFLLQGASAEFSDVHGALDISHFRGMVSVKQLGPEVALSLTSDSGSAQVVLSPDANPDLYAAILYGELNSDLDVTRSRRGPQLAARHPNAEARQKISINASFSQVIIAVEGGSSETEVFSPTSTQAYNDARMETVGVSQGDVLHMDAMVGDVYIEGTDSEELLIEAARIVWTPSAAAGMDALDGLELIVQREDGKISLHTRISQDMSIFNCNAFRINLRIQCPREVPLKIKAEEGLTSVSGMGGGLEVEQGKGEITVEHVRGIVKMQNNNGAIRAKACSGPIEATANYGAVMAEEIYGDIRIHAVEGRTSVDAPMGNLEIRHRSGDVRVLSLEPIQGDFNITVEDGNLSVFMAQESDAVVNVKTTKGRIQSSLPLSGAINREQQEFFGRFNEGLHTVRLESINGDIFLN